MKTINRLIMSISDIYKISSFQHYWEGWIYLAF